MKTKSLFSTLFVCCSTMLFGQVPLNGIYLYRLTSGGTVISTGKVLKLNINRPKRT